MSEQGQILAEERAEHPAHEQSADEVPQQASLAGAILTIALGLALVVLMIPFLQWIDYGAPFSLLEMSAPPAGAVGLLVGLVVVNLVVWVIARTRAFRRWQMALLYVMMMTALPVANLGLVQPLFTQLTNVASEYVNRSVQSVVPAYGIQNPMFFPKVDFDPNAPKEEKALQTQPLKRFWTGNKINLAEEYRLRNATKWEQAKYAWSKIPWKMWAWPLILWGFFLLVLFVGIMFLVEVLRQQWVERENLAFPLAVLPSAMVDAKSEGRARHPLLLNPLLWLGMAVPIVMLALSGLKYYDLVSIPFDELMIDFRKIFTQSPWDALKSNILIVSPILIGVGYLVHLEISRSIWIFFFLGAVYQFAAVTLGWNLVESPPENLDWQIGAYPFNRDQGIGAMLILALFLLYRSRGGLLALVKAPLAGHGRSETPGFMPRRWAAWGFLACFAVLVAWCVFYFNSAPESFYQDPLYAPYVKYAIPQGEFDILKPGLLAVLWLGLFYLMIVAFARLRAEAGIPNNFLVPSLVRVPRVWGGPRVWGWQPSNLLNNHMAWMTMSTLPAMGPLQLEGLEVARRHGPGNRTLAVGVLAAFVTAVGVGGIFLLWNAYFQGQNMLGSKSISHGTMSLWVFYRQRGLRLDAGYFHTPHAIAAIVGAALMAGLLLARSKWLKFPLHPLGYLVWCVVPMHAALVQQDAVKYINLVWGPMLIAWFIKRSVIRYGGMKLYRKLLPIFLGLILGQLLMIVFWSVMHGGMMTTGAEGIQLVPEKPIYVPEAY